MREPAIPLINWRRLASGVALAFVLATSSAAQVPQPAASSRLPTYADLLELKPVQPDVSVERSGLFEAGRDAIFEAGIAEALRLAAAKPKEALPAGR